ncbi:LSU ribosomal protein L10p (P0) [hydrothermal vent metagenome]|uniref:LSU ribosomal protein L10p (P0) n=1 Tax=hydrothermal vent metagenome TaxID=652676 RepID=A0A3B0VQH3_9ZZZZ
MQTRQEKEALVEQFREKIGRANAAFLADYRGIESNSMNELRKGLRGADVDFVIMKNTLARIALKDTPCEPLSSELKGTMAIALSFKDAAAAAKQLTIFAKEESNLDLKMAVLGGKTIDLAGIKALAELPSREELIARLLGCMNNIPGSFVGVLAAVPRQFVYALNAIKDAKQDAA